MPFNFTDSSNIGKDYKDFVLLSVDSLPDYKAQAVYLRHKTTGLEVYHIITDDNENLFSFAFRTLSKNSKGCAHVIEHSVLCGSEKFPLKEPFTTLEAQSVKTFLNAMTYPDKTVYPASSLVRSDYFNLMDVYADAVFFPLLSKKTFMQEGHRFEFGEDGKTLSIQGVVYNEMKANYASFNSVATDLQINKMYPDSVYEYDSGGDPLEIPSLTYEEFLAFHKKFYNPSNCLLFLYGDISTKDQLDFISEKYIGRLEKKFGILSAECQKNISSPFPFLTDEIKNLQKISQLTETTEYRDYAPDVGSTGELVNVSWYTGETNVETFFLSEVLIGNDSSPMSIALKDSKFGDDLSPLCGNFGQFPKENIFSFGLMGVSKKNEAKVRDLIFKSLEKIYEKGISQKDIDSAIMGIDFNLREVTRYFGPISLGLMSKTLSAWAYGYKLDKFLNPITTFENFKKKVREDENFTRSLLKKYFLDNQKYLFSVIEPSKNYISKRNQKELEIIAEAEKTLNKSELKLELKELHEYQQKKESDEELNCIPHLSLEDLDKDYEHTKEYIPTKYFQIKCENQKIPVLYNDEKTNGLVYFELNFPIDEISPDDYKTLPLFADTLTELGWNGKKWNDCFAEANCITGDIWCNVIYGSLRQHPDVEKEIAKYENKNIFGRSYIAICTKFLVEKSREVFDLLTEIVTKMDFKDKKRFETILTEYKTEKKANFIQASSHYLNSRLKAYNTKTGAINELFYGITQFNYADKLSKKDIPELLSKYETFYTKMQNSGCLIHVTADKDSLCTIDKYLPDFCISAKLKEPGVPVQHEKEAFTKNIYAGEENSSCKNEANHRVEVCKISTQSGFAAMGTKCSSWPSKENSAEDILCNYLNNHDLWQKIRMTGGAYGASCSADGTNRLFKVCSWRDPTPAKTLKTYMEILEKSTETKISESDIERAIISCYSDKIVPDSPCSRGNRGFNRFIFVVTKEMLKQDFENILSVTKEDVEKAAKRIFENAKTDRTEVVICDNSTDICGKLLKVEL